MLNQLGETDETKREELMEAFDSFVTTAIEYIKSYFDGDSEFYKKLSGFNAQSFDLLTWKTVVDVADVIHINDLDKDQLYSEFCDIKCFYEYARKRKWN